MIVVVYVIAIVAAVGCLGGYLYLNSARYATRKALRSSRKWRANKWWL